MRPADLLVGAVCRRDAAARHALVLRLVAQHRIVDVLEDFVERLGLVVVAVDVDDAEILVAALDRLFGGMCEQRRGVEFGRGQIAEIAAVDVHGTILFLVSASRIRLTADLRHGLPGAKLEYREAGSIEHCTASYHDIGGRDAAVSPERPRRRPGLRLGGKQPYHAGKNLPERVVRNGVEPVLIDRIGAER